MDEVENRRKTIGELLKEEFDKLEGTVCVADIVGMDLEIIEESVIAIYSCDATPIHKGPVLVSNKGKSRLKGWSK